jgi:diacylglycerol kinase family enzyme
MRYIVILNALSGGLLGRDPNALSRQIVDGFARHGITAAVSVRAGADLSPALAAARDSGPDAIVVGGGDGTIAMAGGMLAGGAIPLGVLPMGTLNLLARDLGLPPDLDSAVAALATAKKRRIDVGEVNGLPFLCAATLGLVPAIGKVRERFRGQSALVAWPSLVLAGARTLYWDAKVQLQLDTGDGPAHLSTRAMAIAVNPYEEGRFFQRTSLDGGRLAVYAVRHRSRWGLLRFVVDLALGRWHLDPALQATTATEVRIASRRRRLAVMLDGERVRLPTPLLFRIRPRALTVLVPA